MRSTRKSKFTYLLVLVVLLTSLACATVTSVIQDPTNTPVPPTTAPTEVPPTEAPTGEEPTVTVVDTEEPTDVMETQEITEEPTEEVTTVSGEPLPIEVLETGFGQDEESVGFAFVLYNPNPSLTLIDLEYIVSVSNEAGQLLDTTTGYLTVMEPEESVGVAGSFYLDEGMTVTDMKVQVMYDDTQPDPFVIPFTTGNYTYIEDDWYSNVTGIVNNPNDRFLDDLYVSAILYDAADTIIGSGYSYVNFLPPQGSSGVEMSVIVAGEVDHIEMYAYLTSSMWWMTSENDNDTVGSPPIVEKSGFGQKESNVGYGFILTNPNEDLIVNDTQYRITLFSSDGNVLATDYGYLYVLLPGESFGIGGSTYIVGEGDAGYIEIIVEPGDYSESDPMPSFTWQNTTFIDDDWSPRVTGEIVNPYSKDLSDLSVFAVLYNAAGEITGGGYSFVEFVFANDTAPAEIYVYSNGDVETAEIYSTIYDYEDLQ